MRKMKKQKNINNETLKNTLTELVGDGQLEESFYYFLQIQPHESFCQKGDQRTDETKTSVLNKNTLSRLVGLGNPSKDIY